MFNNIIIITNARKFALADKKTERKIVYGRRRCRHSLRLLLKPSTTQALPARGCESLCAKNDHHHCTVVQVDSYADRTGIRLFVSCACTKTTTTTTTTTTAIADLHWFCWL